MMNETGLRRILPEQYSGSGHTFGTSRHPSIIDPILSKRVCFYKSGDPQFNGLRLVINNRTFKTFDALLDSLSKKVPLPFGVRNITTPRGVHAINTLDELEDGKSYICSDSRKVKPINLALARKKLPPWYHARPVSSRRRTVQQARFFPGRSLHKQEQVLVRTPKRLLVFCNGDPTIKHTVVLNKKTTPSYEAILEYISALMQFHVLKLHTPDGRRVDGLPGLILCSGTVVAVGREPFRPAIYSEQKSPAPKWLHTNRMADRRQKALNLKKKSLSYSSKSRNFSPSSERYIVHQIHNRIAESSCEIPSNPTNSVEFESSRILESVSETEEDICLDNGADGQICSLPSEDDIEKSFRVNQDGSMTVEMKVRLTIKEEETVHWTTTLSRSSVASQLNAACLPEPEAEQEICSLKSTSLDLQSPSSSIDTINKDKTKDNNDEDPPSPSNGAFSESGTEEDEIKSHTDVASPTRAPTPGHKQISTKEASVESIKSVTAGEIQEGMIESYSYREQTENRTMTEQYCMIKQSSTRPVPKPRRLGSVDTNSRNVSAFKSAGIMQIESSGEEVTETVLHIYEQQTCQDNFLANVCTHSVSASGITFSRPATAETGHFSSSNEFEPEPWRPSTASESINIWRAESVSATSDLNLPSLKTAAIQAANKQQQFQNSTKSQIKPQEKRVSPKPKVINKHVRRLLTPGKKQKENSTRATESRKKVRTPPTFSSAGFIKRIYGNKFKSAKTMKRLKKRQAQNRDATTNSPQVADDAIESVAKAKNKPLALKENTTERASFESNRLGVVVTQPRRVLTRQTSMHMEKKSESEPRDISESMSLPAFNSFTSGTNEYVENWLEKSHLDPPSYLNEKSKKIEEVTENGGCVESDKKHGLITVEEKVKCLEETSETCPTFEPPPENLPGMSVKLRVQSFENKSAEKSTVSQQILCNETTTANTDHRRSLSQKNTEEIKPLSNGICSQMIPPTSKTSTEMPLDGEVEYKSTPVKISFQKATPTNTLSMELPPPPPELSDTEYCMSDVSSVASSSLDKDSSLNSERTDNHPSSNSPTSDKAVSPTDSTTEITSSVHKDVPSTLRDAPSPTTPSIKRASLVSNLSLERKMSLRKAGLDKYTLSSDVHSETSPLSAPISTVGDDVLPNGICLTGTQQSIKAAPEETQQSFSDPMGSPSCCTSVSPASLTSEDRAPSPSILSSEGSMRKNLQIRDTKTSSLVQKEASSPKSVVKKAKLQSSPSPERKFQMKKSSLELPSNPPKSLSQHIRPSVKNASPNSGIQKHADPNAGTPTERKQKLYKPKLQKRSSPYSQSLDMVSPPGKNKSSRKLFSRNLSSDTPLEPTNRTQKKTSQRKSHQTPQLVKSEPELDKTPTGGAVLSPAADKRDENKADREKSLTDVQITPQPLNTTDQPIMKPVLEKICFSIKSIRQITQNKRPSCLEKSNSLPDFSSHVASTFGSSSKALLAFLSVMTLKEGITNLNMDELNANNVSCAEALKMIDSLREIASIEDSHKLHTSLSNLQHSASKQLLQSWKGFQELSDKCQSRSSTPESLELITEDGPEQDCGSEESVINGIMDSLDIPVELKKELASFRVGSKSDNEENIIQRAEMSTNDNTNHFPNEDCVNVTQEHEANVYVRSIIKKFTDINQTKQPGMDKTHLITETAKHKPTNQASKDNNSQHGQNGETKYPPAEPNYQQISEERQLHSAALFVQENGLDWQSCRDAVHQEHEEENEGNSTEDRANFEKEPEEQDVESRQLQTESEESMSIPENESEHDDKSGSEEERQDIPSANKVLAQKDSCEQTVSGSEAGEQQSSEEGEPEVACEEINQDNNEIEDLSNPESHSDKEENKQSSSNYVELNARETESSPESENQSEEEQSEVECKELSNKDDSSKPACLSGSEKEQQNQTCSMGLNVSVEESTGNSDVDESYSEEEQPEVEFKELQVIVEESLSGIEDEEDDDIVHLHNPPKDGVQTKTFGGLNALIEEPEEDKDSSEDENLHSDQTQTCDKNTVGRALSNVIENQDLYTKNDSSSLIKPDSLGKHRFGADDDSGNDHSSCEDHVEEEHPKVNEEHISSSMEEELSYYDKESSSEEEQVNMESYIEESCIQYHKAPALETQPEVTKCEKAMEKLKHPSEEVISQSVAERISLLEKHVADAQKRKDTTENSPIRRFSQRNVPAESDEEDSPSDSPTSQLTLFTRSAPQSSLSFSYDSSGVITTEPEGNRVRCIREMFLAKSTTDIQERRFPSQQELRAETSVSGGYQSQTSSELSSGEDDSVRKSITKGFVRRTIERLYGRKDAQPDEESGERPTPEPKQKRKEHSSIFSPFHTARAKAMSELSYFNSTNALDTLSEATRCIAFNAQVGPGDGVPLDDGQWLLRENTLIRKSVSDPVGINKTFTNTPKDDDICKDTQENTPYSLFSTKPELEEKTKPITRKCTYFSLPHASASESDACQDDVSMVSKSSPNGSDGVIEAKDNSEDSKSCTERNGMLPGVGDFKIKDNKVHPLTEPPPDGEVVVVQPGKGYGVVNRRYQEPDMLDILYNFCGEHCPIL
ncbi:oxygen-regulated protein 1-like [Amphiprion ocellaris]|uniref:oxygen-regulated protein 1-like n=1 Tax=Amphiprion ocellaris TaxID=80972 RepID=UPI002410D53A|nr:oxygen-regulated protein 1-like [Amphiprion ocellaris]XP_054863104.1 oxygen-regulated protein 1-like [Amphiprion ocellaris]XP_054863105.1 oxygen-regulated protein 1-like [Amphiprion ocellaris]